MRSSRILAPLALLALATATTGCGSKQAAGPAPAESGAAAAEPSGGLQPCELLSAEQVATVLRDAAPGMTARSGGSLIQGIDAYQCSYVNPTTELLVVILNVAADDARFAEIAPGSAMREDRQRIEVGDEGWMSVAPNEVKIKAVRGRTVIDVELTAPGAAGRAPRLIAVARAVAAKLG